MKHLPKIMHMIWLGKAPLPQASRLGIQTFRMHHGDDWRLILWTDTDAAPVEGCEVMRLPPTLLDHVVSQLEIEPALSKYGKAILSDLYRWVMLWEYGGIYADLDVIFLQNIEPLYHDVEISVPWGFCNRAVENWMVSMPFRSRHGLSLMEGMETRLRYWHMGTNQSHPLKIVALSQSRSGGEPIPYTVMPSYALAAFNPKFERPETIEEINEIPWPAASFAAHLYHSSWTDIPYEIERPSSPERVVKPYWSRKPPEPQRLSPD